MKFIQPILLAHVLRFFHNVFSTFPIISFGGTIDSYTNKNLEGRLVRTKERIEGGEEL